MSFILEALRKSEAERRRGQAPQLFDAPAPLPSPPPAPTRAAWWWALPALLALPLALLWWRGSSPDGVPMPTAQQPVADARVSTPSTLPPPVAAQRDAPSRIVPPPAAVAEAPGPAPTPVAVPEPPAPAAISRPLAREALAQPAPAGAGPAVMPAAPIAGDPAPAPARNASVAMAPAAAEPPAPAVPSSATGETLRLADLSTSERSALPPLRMSLHMWAPVPANRFVILDGSRVGEGDRIGNAVVDEITPDGAVLAWQGRRLKVPVR